MMPAPCDGFAGLPEINGNLQKGRYISFSTDRLRKPQAYRPFLEEKEIL